MKFYIDGRMVSEREFWRKVYALANREQKARLLEGKVVILSGSEYQIDVK